MPDGKRTDPKRRSPASRPGKAGDSVRRRRPAKPVSKPSQSAAQTGRTGTRALREPVDPDDEPIVDPVEPLAQSASAKRSDQRLGFTARRAAVLASVVCVLTLTIAGPVRTYFAQRTEMEQLAASEAALRGQIADLEQKKTKLGDPAYIAAQARERLGFVMPGTIPFQVQLPPTAAEPAQPGAQTAKPANNEPWYTALWHTVADTPHLPPTTAPSPEGPPSPADPGLPGPAPPAAPNPTAPGG